MKKVGVITLPRAVDSVGESSNPILSCSVLILIGCWGDVKQEPFILPFPTSKLPSKKCVK